MSRRGPLARGPVEALGHVGKCKASISNEQTAITTEQNAPESEQKPEVEARLT